MGITRNIVVVFIVAMVMSFVLSIDVHLVAGAFIMAFLILGLVVGIIGGIKLLPHIERNLENNNKKAIRSLVKDINRSHKTIRIVGGTANPEVYNNEKVEGAFKKAIQRGVKIQVAFSEIDLNKKNTIIELAKKKEIELYIPNRGKVPRNHFRVIDTISVYSEKGHAANAEKRYYERFDNIYNMAIRFENAFGNIIDNSEMLYA